MNVFCLRDRTALRKLTDRGQEKHYLGEILGLDIYEASVVKVFFMSFGRKSLM